MTNAYEVLQVSELAPLEVIQAAWKALSKKYHPDSGAAGDVERQKLVNQAYEILRDPEKRRAHDRALAEERGRGGDPRNAQTGHFDFSKVNANAYPVAYPGMQSDIERMGQRLAAHFLEQAFDNLPEPIREMVIKAATKTR